MPFRGEVDRGTEADGRSSVDYCVGCYPNGTFTEPNLTMARMIENARKQMQAEGFPEGDNRAEREEDPDVQEMEIDEDVNSRAITRGIERVARDGVAFETSRRMHFHSPPPQRTH